MEKNEVKFAVNNQIKWMPYMMRDLPAGIDNLLNKIIVCGTIMFCTVKFLGTVDSAIKSWEKKGQFILEIDENGVRRGRLNGAEPCPAPSPFQRRNCPKEEMPDDSDSFDLFLDEMPVAPATRLHEGGHPLYGPKA